VSAKRDHRSFIPAHRNGLVSSITLRWSHFSGKRVERGSGAGVPYEPLPESLQRIMEDLDYQI
jgi:hypothetical protein